MVTDPKKVLLALRWVINEMEKRYRMMAKAGVRNIAAYNMSPKEKNSELDLNLDSEEKNGNGNGNGGKQDDLVLPDKMPYIVRYY